MPSYGVLMRNGINYSHDTAESISYDNIDDGILSSANVQDAIDEFNTMIENYGKHYVAFDYTTSIPSGKHPYERGEEFTITNSNIAKTVSDGGYTCRLIFSPADSTYDPSKNMTLFIYRASRNNAVMIGDRNNPTLATCYLQNISTTSTSVTFAFFMYPSTPAMKLYRLDIAAI